MRLPAIWRFALEDSGLQVILPGPRTRAGPQFGRDRQNQDQTGGCPSRSRTETAPAIGKLRYRICVSSFMSRENAPGTMKHFAHSDLPAQRGIQIAAVQITMPNFGMTSTTGRPELTGDFVLMLNLPAADEADKHAPHLSLQVEQRASCLVAPLDGVTGRISPGYRHLHDFYHVEQAVFLKRSSKSEPLEV